MEIAARGHGALGVTVCPLLDRVDEIEVAVHLLVFDKGTAEDDLRNEDDGDNEDCTAEALMLLPLLLRKTYWM
jgi:hypothetical protein